MGNSYFQFKKFRIDQDQAAMKVCTDACVFGAWAARQIDNSKEILDIGAGTGLLMHMIASKSSAHIYGIEIDDSAFNQCRANIAANSFKERMKVFQGDIKTYSFHRKFDFIISNPPFYENNLKPEKESSKIAMHSSNLTLEELVRLIPGFLTDEGKFAVLLPMDRKTELLKMTSENNLYPAQLLSLKHSRKHNPFRIIGLFGKDKITNVQEEELIIRENEGNYTNEFIQLLKPYYLYL